MASIRGMSNPVKGSIFELTGDTLTIGRSPDNQACIRDASVSGKHCVIERDGNKYTLRDLDSTNGTHINGVKIKVSRLKPKDIIKIGSVDLLFDGENVEIDTETETVASERSKTSKIVNVEEQAVGQTQVSSAFGKKRDLRRVVNALVFLLAALVLGLLIFFVLRMFQQ